MVSTCLYMTTYCLPIRLSSCLRKRIRYARWKIQRRSARPWPRLPETHRLKQYFNVSLPFIVIKVARTVYKQESSLAEFHAIDPASVVFVARRIIHLALPVCKNQLLEMKYFLIRLFWVYVRGLSSCQSPLYISPPSQTMTPLPAFMFSLKSPLYWLLCKNTCVPLPCILPRTQSPS